MTIKTHSISNTVPSNIYESLVSQINVKLTDDLTEDDSLSSNILADKHYTLVKTVIPIASLWNLYSRFTDIHTITSEDELNFYYDLGDVPLTKKYLYQFDQNIDTTITDNAYIVHTSIDVYDLIYNNLLKNSFFTNIYALDSDYISLLTKKDSIDVSFVFGLNQFDTTTDFTNYIEGDLQEDICNHMNCILFNDILIYDHFNNNTTLSILTDVGCEEAFIINVNDSVMYTEGGVDNYTYNITNFTDTTTINNINLDIVRVPLYDNIIYVKSYPSSSEIQYNMVLLNKLYPVLDEHFYSGYYNIKLANEYLFDTYDFLTSDKLSDYIYESDSIMGYISKYTNNNYLLDSTNTAAFKVIDIYYKYKGEEIIVQSYPLRTLTEKFHIMAIGINNNANYYAEQHLIPTNTYADISHNVVTSLSGLSGTETNPTILDLGIPNKDVDQYYYCKNEDTFDVNPYTNNNRIETNYKGFKGLAFTNTVGDYALHNTNLPLVYPCCDNSITVRRGREKELDGSYDTFNNSNMSITKSTGLFNDYSSEFTFTFITSKQGFFYNELVLGGFWANYNGKLSICNNNNYDDIMFDVDMTNLDTTSAYSNILHIISYDNGQVMYEAYNDTTRYCSLDTTVDISKCNISLFNIITTKSTVNNTTDSNLLDPHTDKQEEYIGVGYHQMFNQKLPQLRIDQIKEQYQLNALLDTAPFIV